MEWLTDSQRYGGPSQRQASGTNPTMKVLPQGYHFSMRPYLQDIVTAELCYSKLYLTDCKYPITPIYGSTSLKTAGITTYEAIAIVSCNKGYSLDGNETMVCKADGFWSKHAKCIIKGTVFRFVFIELSELTI